LTTRINYTIKLSASKQNLIIHLSKNEFKKLFRLELPSKGLSFWIENQEINRCETVSDYLTFMLFKGIFLFEGKQISSALIYLD